MRPYIPNFRHTKNVKYSICGEINLFRGSVGLSLNRPEISIEDFPRLSFLRRIPVEKWVIILEKLPESLIRIRGRRVRELVRFFESKVESTLIIHGQRQRSETLINEEALLLAKYLRGERAYGSGTFHNVSILSRAIFDSALITVEP